MSSGKSVIVPSREDRGVVVFYVWQSLPYEWRMGLSYGFIVAGLFVQALTSSILPGVVGLALGNLLLLVIGYDNRIDFRKFDPGGEWETADAKKLTELRRIEQQIQRWDRSLLDVTNSLGMVMFVLVAGSLAALAWFVPGVVRLLAVDAMVLLLPHWITGIRMILTMPGLLIKVRSLESLVLGAVDRLRDHRVDVMVLLQGTETKLPRDVKVRIRPQGAHEDFLGLYGQVVINEVQGKSFPYFYVVLVARNGFGLEEARDEYDCPYLFVKEFKVEGNVEVLVIRQKAGKSSGYHTPPATQSLIFADGLDVAERWSRKTAGAGA